MPRLCSNPDSLFREVQVYLIYMNFLLSIASQQLAVVYFAYFHGSQGLVGQYCIILSFCVDVIYANISWTLYDFTVFSLI